MSLNTSVPNNISDTYAVPSLPVQNISDKEDKANKGIANGYAPLDANAKVPTANLPDFGVDEKLSTHNSATTNVHGIANTENLVLTNDARLSDARTPTAHAHAISDVTGLQTALDEKQVSGSYSLASHTHSDATTSVAGFLSTTDKTKLDSVASGAEVNVNADWNASSGDAQILNKPASFVPTAHTHPASGISDSSVAGRALLTASTVQAQRTALDIFVTVANDSALPVVGNFQRVYTAADTGKIYAWNGGGYTEISPNTHTRAGSGNVNVGETALTSASLSGGSNTAVGNFALALNTAGSHNTAIGGNALVSNLTGNYNTANGYNALGANNAGNNNTASGVNALTRNNGNNNTASGVNSLGNNTSGNNNTANGLEALLYNGSGSNNTADGVEALRNNTVGGSNTAHGVASLRNNISGESNTAIGRDALYSNETGNNNTASGINSLRSNISGGSNTAIGANSGNTLTTGIQNVIIGSNANVDATNRNRCVVLGFSAVSPAVDGSLSIGGSGNENYMTGLVTTTAPTGGSFYLRIWLNGYEYRIPAVRAT